MKSRGLVKTSRGRGNRGASTAGNIRNATGASAKKWTHSGTSFTPPVVTEGYGANQLPRQIAAIEEHQEEEELPQVDDSNDVLDEMDFNTMDEATIAALYEEIRDIPIELPVEERQDFPEGQ